ncbi:hypothetical protein BT96DRAFT_929412 [Gymnopus androsaceus JB14]|uniref:Uncharacterized protein n=1 Tax=Gymnopus androsaceus JB14 TaxID=1447944 RepID=A0A6A4GFL2_9AGAR|nr:hypothetical protein BT96DRAFT_929412 [Gymnopus androsaceus JB14]
MNHGCCWKLESIPTGVWVLGYGYGFGSTRPPSDNWHQRSAPNRRFGLVLSHAIDASSSLESDGRVHLSGPYSTQHSTSSLEPTSPYIPNILHRLVDWIDSFFRFRFCWYPVYIYISYVKSPSMLTSSSVFRLYVALYLKIHRVQC